MFSKIMKCDLAEELANGFDVLHLEQLMCGWVGLGYSGKSVTNVHFLHSIDLEQASVGWRARWLMNRAERLLLRSFSRFAALSDRLAHGIRNANPRAVVDVVPLGIDPSLYPYIPDNLRTTEPVISVIGSMTWHPSRSAAARLLTRLWPGIKARVPDARVQVVGWGARSALREFIGLPDVTIDENVPDIRPYFERTGVLLYAPERGSGMKVKVMEAFAFGVPVVTTTEGVEGMPAIDGVHAVVCDDDAGLIDRTVELLRDPARQNRQRAAARELLERHCGPEPTVTAFEGIYADIIRGAS
jgi:glycosyltransferase involved in cell wall biosynthesis